ncbi:MAG: recombinase family protein [Pseudomonadota bacterium]
MFDDLKRFARDTVFHIKLRQEFHSRGARVECLNFRIENTPEGRFSETIVAAQGELEREQNKRQTVQKMQARVEKGYWVFCAPMGLRYGKVAGHGKLLVRKEPVASIIQEAMEGFASGRFETQVKVKRFLEVQPAFPKDHANGEIRAQKVTDILNNPLFGGCLERPNWDISLRKAQHEGLM